MLRSNLQQQISYHWADSRCTLSGQNYGLPSPSFPVSVVSSTWQVDPQVVPQQRKTFTSSPPQTALHLQARRFPRQKPKSDRPRSESTSLLSEVEWVRAGRCAIWHCESGGSVRSHRHRAQSPCGSTPETASAPVRKNPARPFPQNYHSA